MLNHETLKQAVDAYAAGWAAGDPDALTALYAEGARIEDPVGTPPHEGLDAIRALFTKGVGMGASVVLTGALRISGDSVAFPLDVHVHMDGQDVRIEAIDLFRFNQDHKIVEHLAFFSEANIHAQNQ